MESGPKRKSATTRRAGLGAVVAAVLLTCACAAGQRAETAEEKATLDGTVADIGTMALRGLALEAPTAKPYYIEGSDVAVKLVLINNGTSADQLTGISSSAFTSWSAYDTADEASAAAAADDPLAEPTGTPSDASSGASPSSASSSAASGGSQSVTVPPGSRVGFGTPEATGGLLVTKLKRTLYPANTIRITFTFAKAGSKSVLVPVQLTAGANDSVIPEPSSTGEGG